MSWYQRLYLVDRVTYKHNTVFYHIIASLCGGIWQNIKFIKAQIFRLILGN